MLPPGYWLWQVYPQLIGTVGHAVVRVQLWYHPRIEGAGQMLITEPTGSPCVPRSWQSAQERGQWTPIRVRGVPGWAAPAAIAWHQDGLIYSVSSDPPLTTAQFVADSATGR